MSLYADYVKEVYDRRVIETDKMLIMWSLQGDVLFLEDMFIKREFRGQGFGKEALDMICDIAKNNGCREVMISILQSCKYKDENMSIFLHVGFKLASFAQGIVYLKKEV